MKTSFVLLGKVSEILLRIEHVSIFPASYLPSHIEDPGFIVEDSNFLSLDEMIWTVDCGGNKTINLLNKNSAFSLKCF